MAQITTIKEDEFGLFVIAGGYISRPFYGTKFQVGDKVKTHHFGGSTNAGVTIPDKPETHNFKKGGQFEYWSTTGIPSYKFDQKSKEEVKEKTEWYKKNSRFTGRVYTNLNLNFEK